MMNRFFSLGFILLLLAGCSTLNATGGNKTLGNVKLYEGAPLPDSEVSVLRGISGLEAQLEGGGITYYAWSTTNKVDGKYADGEAAPGYLNYSWKEEKRWPPFGKANIDYHLKPGVHTILTYIGSYVWLDEGRRYGSTKAVSAKYRLAYDFKKGCRYRIGTHFKTIERTTEFKKIYVAGESRIWFTYTVWLQQVNADGSVVDVAQFTKIGQDYSK
ncbi:MAG: hypothetical protein NT088_05220 [Candidatus Omnitrophica bacterium]|nr:hypothetical protein [Candidatus Omnitrophota bacterium]